MVEDNDTEPGNRGFIETHFNDLVMAIKIYESYIIGLEMMKKVY